MTTPPPNPFFKLVIATGFLFAVTTMAMFAATFGDPAAPPNRFFDRYGLIVIAIETIALVVVSWLALAVDRRQTLRHLKELQAANAERPVEEPPGPAEAP